MSEKLTNSLCVTQDANRLKRILVMSTLIKTLQLIYGSAGERSDLDTVNTEKFLTSALFLAQLEQEASEERKAG
jgi:hypothetical protein